MKLRQLAEAALYVSAHCPAFIEAPGVRPESPLTEFWLLSRHRLQGWMSAIDHLLLRTAATREPDPGEVPLRTLLEEIFVGEMLARIWSAAVAAVGRASADRRYDKLVRNVFIGHLQARHRALTLVADAQRLSPGDLTHLDQVRRRAERWTDVLLGHLICRYDVDEFAFEPERAREFGRTQQSHGRVAPDHPVWELIAAGLRMSFPDGLRLAPAQCERNRELAAAALAMLRDVPAEASSPAAARERVVSRSAIDGRPAADRGTALPQEFAAPPRLVPGRPADAGAPGGIAFSRLRPPKAS